MNPPFTLNIPAAHRALSAYVNAIGEFEKDVARLRTRIADVRSKGARLPVPAFTSEIKERLDALPEALSLGLSDHARDIVTPAVKAALQEAR